MTQTGIVLFGVHEWLVTFDLADPNPILSAGTYWFIVYQDNGGDDWFWEVGNVDFTHGVPGSVWGTACPPTFPNSDPATDFAWELIEGTTGAPTNDCNENGILDECDIGMQWGGFCFGPDCSSDWNYNGIPDECEACGDFVGTATAYPYDAPDGLVNDFDYWYIHDGLGFCSGHAKYDEHALADLDHDNCITLVDYQNWLTCYRMANGKEFKAPKLRPAAPPEPIPTKPASPAPMDRESVGDWSR
jgi:hypothetical protein